MTTSSDRATDADADRGLEAKGRAGRATETTADPSVVAELRRQLMVERERSLNATDRVLGAQAEAAQSRAEIKELEYRLHVREAELGEAAELLARRPETGGGPGARTARLVTERVRTAVRNLAAVARWR